MTTTIEKNNTFATFETQTELFKYINSMTGPGESYNMALGAGLMWNTIAHILKEDKNVKPKRNGKNDKRTKDGN